MRRNIRTIEVSDDRARPQRIRPFPMRRADDRQCICVAKRCIWLTSGCSCRELARARLSGLRTDPLAPRAFWFWVYAYPAFLMYAAHSSGRYWTRICALAWQAAS
jgi:hypothetical protein